MESRLKETGSPWPKATSPDPSQDKKGTIAPRMRSKIINHGPYGKDNGIE